MPVPESPRISVTIPGHGTHTVTAAALDVTMERYLPSRVANLRAIASERANIDYSDVVDASALLVILADFDHNVDHSPLRAY